MQPFKIEEFLAGQMNTSAPPRSYLPALKNFFGFAVQQGAVASDPMKVVRLPRGAGGTAKRATASAAPVLARRPPMREMDVVYVSRAQRDSMQAELDRLRNEERHRVSVMLHDAIKDGDLSENAAYDDAKMRQGMLEAKIRELEAKLRNVELIEDQDRSGSSVAVGSQVRLEHVASGDLIDYQVVGPEETDPRAGKISHLGFDLLRAQIVTQSLTLAIKVTVRRDRPTGECCAFPSGHASNAFACAQVWVEVTTPGGSARYRIVSVE